MPKPFHEVNMHIKAIIDQLAATSSRNEKEAILQAHQKNHLLRQVVFLALDPFTNFYIRKIPAYKHNPAGRIDLKWAIDFTLPILSKRQATGHAAIAVLKEALELLPPDDAAVLELIIKKDLRCGVQRSTANKIWPDLIGEYPVMLASAYSQKLVDKIKFPAIAQLKADGMRFNAIVRNGAVEYFGRSGKEINLLGSLDADFIALAESFPWEEVVFDGELLVMQGNEIAPRQIGNGILNKAVKGTISQREADMVCAQLWDVIPFHSFQAGVDKTPYHKRIDTLAYLGNNQRITFIETRIVKSMDEARQVFEEFLARGQEGIILKDKDMPWEAKRSKKQIKFKAELECDLRVTGWNEGTGKHSGRLGALTCETSDSALVVNVGSGFSDAQRDEYTPENTIGKIVSVKYNAKIVDANGNNSLFLPRFIEIREDKDEADSFKAVK
jgi:hypothetical protein